MSDNQPAMAQNSAIHSENELEGLCLKGLEDYKAKDLVSIDVEGRSSIADHMLICSGTSTRHVAAIADHLAKRLSDMGFKEISVSGEQSCEWVIVDAGGVMVHIMCPEARERYRLEDLYRTLSQTEA